MPFELIAAIVDSGDHQIKVKHTFYGDTEAECQDYFKEHLGTCSYFRSAEKEGNVISWLRSIEELPTPESMNEQAKEEDESPGEQADGDDDEDVEEEGG